VCKKIILTSISIAIVLAMVVGLFFEHYVQEYFQEFTSINFASLIVIVIGVLYALIRRNVIVPVAFFFIACALPWIKYWIINYWDNVQLPW